MNQWTGLADWEDESLELQSQDIQMLWMLRKLHNSEDFCLLTFAAVFEARCDAPGSSHKSRSVHLPFGRVIKQMPVQNLGKLT